jgi:hypothetical protein
MSTSVLMAVWVTNLAIFVWKHRRELATLPRLRKSGTPID